MPAFTQEELDELAYAEPIETRNDTSQSTTETRVEVGNEGVMEDSDGAQMKHELEADIRQVPSDIEHDERMEEDANEEFTEAREHLNPQEMTDQELDATNHNEDVPMEDVADDEDAEETEETTEDNAVQSGTSIQPDPHPDHKSELGAANEEASESDSESQSESENQQDAESDDSEEEEEDNDESEASETTEGSESESASEAESDSESQEEDDENVADDTAVPAVCSLCHKLEEDDDEDLLECSKCESRVHSECAQDNEWIKDGADTDSWQCVNCVRAENSESPKETSKRNRNSAPRLVRDLLPVSRGVQRPNSHSIFAQPLISESEDGGRALRKRKSPTVEPPVSEKRRRKATPKALLASLPELSKAESTAHATRRTSQKSMPTARILQYRPYEKAPPHKFILAFRLDQSKIEKILDKPPRPGRRRDRRKPPKIPPPPIFHPPVPKFPALPTNHLIFPSMWGDRENEVNAKPYGGILSDAEADTSRSLPQLKDRELFEIARKEAEEERRKTSAAAEAEINGESANTTKPNRTVSGPPSKIKCIQFGKHVIDTFYAAPYPEEYSHESRLFICEFCLKYLPSEFVAYRHKLKCPAKHPPGDEIYRDGTISVWEVDGRKKTEYCQCLCLMAKMFLGSKTLYYDVEPFLFYILTEYDEFGYHFVGYFSKEKRPASQNNVSCILVMPIHQRKGYATFLIDFSYLLTRIEGKDGSPEKPLSDMGLTAYRSYWDLTVARQLLDIGMKPFSTKDLMQRTGMTADDVVHSLERLYAFVKDPVTKTYAIRYDQKLYQNIITEFESKKHRELRPEKLIWTPYIMGRSDQAHLDTQPVQTIAPREGDEVIVEDNQDTQDISTGEEPRVEQEISPKTAQDPAKRSPSHAQTKDPRLVNGVGQVAPGPPSAQLLTGVVTSTEEPEVNGITGDASKDPVHPAESLSGYALTHRTLNIPTNRYQIDPPIPPSMLRSRTHKKRNTGFGRRTTNGDSAQTPTAMAPVRSSPRHAASANGSVNGSMDNGSPEKSSTPVRRSNRKSGLSTMEVAGLDGSVDPDEEDIGDEIEAKLESESESESSSAEDSESGEAEDDDEDAEIPEDEEEDEEDDDGEVDDDPDALDIVNESEEDESDED